MLDFLLLKSAISDYTSVLSFVDGGDISRMFSAIGDVHYEAAIAALTKRNMSKDKKFPVQSAINHLEAASVSYAKIYTSHRYFRVASWLVAGYKGI